MIRKYTDDELREAVKVSTTYSGVFRELGMRKSGPAMKVLKERIESLEIDTSHFTHVHRGYKVRPIESLLVKNGPSIPSHGLKVRLLKAGLLKLECSLCGIKEWRGETNIFDMDHINGDRADNRIENLRILCANCHRTTKTWGRNKKDVPRVKESTSEKRDILPGDRRSGECLCGSSKSVGSLSCYSCHKKNFDRSVYKYPPIEEALMTVEELGWVGAAKTIGCSDNALRKYVARSNKS